MLELDSSVPDCLRLRGKSQPAATGYVVGRGDDEFYRIENYPSMPPFLVSLTSPSDHWIFVSTTGGITAGRKNSDHAIFPYQTEDRVAEYATTTGALTILLVEAGEKWLRWEPFASALDGIYNLRRAVEKNATGNTITFEECNDDLDLTFRQTWTSSPEYGIVRQCSLNGAGSTVRDLIVLDGIRNTLPALTSAAFQANFSVLLDAYKRNELLADTGIGVFGLSAVPTDAAAPSEALAATTWWQHGLEPQAILLSTEQLDRFRRSGTVVTETDVKGRRGAYLVMSRIRASEGCAHQWFFCGEVDQQYADVAALNHELQCAGDDVRNRVNASVARATSRLHAMLSRNDGIQTTGNSITRLHHAANVTYNTMRGGYFAYGYEVPVSDFGRFIERRNSKVAAEHADLVSSLGATIRVDELQRRVDELDDPDMSRLTLEYLPLTFSRRHGDPSRPWNAFSIENQEPDGSPRLAYQGNWRDIFQNWEALLHSYPLFLPNVIAKFLNATTIDGYNPYRITDSGIEWEKPDPDSPWANIGYWGDHQIIYLLKLLELSEAYQPGRLKTLLDRRIFSFADVPYRIASFDQMLENPYETIAFDTERDRAAMERHEQIGGDGNLLHGGDGSVVHATMIEKLVLLALAKASNFIPDGGIWMNTQRPEWNDANNALVGKGVSVVTTAYLQRYSVLLLDLLDQIDSREIAMFEETAGWVDEILDALRAAAAVSENGWNPASRLDSMRRFGGAAHTFRQRVFTGSFSGRTRRVDRESLIALVRLIETIAAGILERNRRPDELFHSYNTLSLDRDDGGRVIGVSVLPLYEMLEGQVAAISAPAVNPAQAQRTLAALRSSTLYRDDQHSYMLYPNRELPGFMNRNVIQPEAAESSAAIGKLLADRDQPLIIADHAGGVHFDASCRNAIHLRDACHAYLRAHPQATLTEADVNELMELYESVFQHQHFTGRSGTFYGYEGLGSIYWHMVSKLLLAAQENVIRARQAGDRELAEALRTRFFDIRSGIGFNKGPDVYGAFPTDPYSHTPLGGGARQPGMTGQVKEEIIARFAELGLYVIDGRIVFDSFLVADEEFLSEAARLTYVDVYGTTRQLEVAPDSFAYTFCQTPIVVFKVQSGEGIAVHRRDGSYRTIGSLDCPRSESAAVFARSGEINRIEVSLVGIGAAGP